MSARVIPYWSPSREMRRFQEQLRSQSLSRAAPLPPLHTTNFTATPGVNRAFSEGVAVTVSLPTPTSAMFGARVDVYVESVGGVSVVLPASVAALTGKGVYSFFCNGSDWLPGGVP